jgi:hypothetical protein
MGINGVVVVASVGRVSAAPASASAAAVKPVGRPWLWMAIIEAARGSSSRPTTSNSRPCLGP